VNDRIIEAHPDCVHPNFDVMERCVSCGRDFTEQRAAGARSLALIEAENARILAAAPVEEDTSSLFVASDRHI
jgi:hypothetical protein